MESLAQPDRLFSQCTYCQGRTARADGEEHEVEAEMGGECVVLQGGGPGTHGCREEQPGWWLYFTRGLCFPVVSLQVAVQLG